MTSSTLSSTPSSAPITTPITVSRRYPGAPLVGVAVAIYNAAGAVLLALRGRPPRTGTWGLPGGLIDVGETLAAAAVREVMEEVGLTIEVGGLVTTYESIHPDAQGVIEYHYVVLEYWAHYQGGKAVAQDDTAALAWVDRADFDAYALTPEQLVVLRQAHAAWHAAPPPHLHTATFSV